MQQKKLNLNKENIKREPLTPEEASLVMARFYATMENCMLNLVAIQNDIAKSLREISSDTSEIVELALTKAVQDGLISQDEMDSRLDGDEDEPPANSEAAHGN